MIMRKHNEDYKEVGFIKKKVNGNYKDVQKIYRRDEDGNYRVIFERGYGTEYDGANNFRVPAVGKDLKDYTIFGNSEQNGFPTPDSPIEPEFCGDLVSIELDEPLRAVGNYKDTLDLETGVLTRRIMEWVFDGSANENWSIRNDICFRFRGNPKTINNQSAGSLSSHFYGYTNTPLSQISRLPDNSMCGCNGEAEYLCRYDTVGYTDVSDFKSYLAQQYANNTPVKVWYVLVDPIVTTISSIPDGLTGVIEGTVTQSGTPTPDNPVEPVFNGTLLPNGKYQVYTTYKIPISSAGQTKNIYLGQVQTTRRIKKLVLTGAEAFTKYAIGNQWSWTLGIRAITANFNDYTCLANTYIGICSNGYDYVGAAPDKSVFTRVTYGDVLYIMDMRFTEVADFKTYLAQQYAAGTPVIVWYVLATPEIGIVNEPLCRIGDYADSVNLSQTGVSISTLPDPQTTLITIPTSVPPSEIIANYKAYKRPKYPPFLTKDGKTFDTKNGQSLYLGGYE